jgi:hypothetical protein
VVGYEKANIHGELMTRIGKGVATNKNGLGIEFISKNSKVQLSEIGVVVCANTMVHTSMEELDFLHMNSQIMSHWGKGDLDRRTESNIIYSHVCNLCPVW